jgi:2-polyprenyl-3-methyl-5-hydroxy-6-metoxy-1,4-benzoquinol methylase
LGTSRDYVLGHAEPELKRLERQARLIDPITKRFFQSAGIADGMRILDVGSGAGDVAILVGRMVGPNGAIVGTDTSPVAIATAEHRVEAAGLTNVVFRTGDPSEMTFDQPFDAVVGRYVLQYLADPAASLACLAKRLRPGGLLVFHELDWSGTRSIPAAATFDLACSWIDRTIASYAQSRLGLKLASHFRMAGLPPAEMQLEAAIGAGQAAREIVCLVTELVETLLPSMSHVGVASEVEVSFPTLEARILAEVGADTTLIARLELVAWTRV